MGSGIEDKRWLRQMDLDYDQYGGTPPHVRGSDTSHEAATSMGDDAQRLREVVFSHINAAKTVGMTCDEVEQAMDGRHQTVSARIKELRNAGRIVDTGRRRKTRSGRNAAVYIATALASPETVANAVQPTSKVWTKVTLGEVAAAFSAGGFTIRRHDEGYTLTVAKVTVRRSGTLNGILMALADEVHKRSSE